MPDGFLDHVRDFRHGMKLDTSWNTKRVMDRLAVADVNEYADWVKYFWDDGWTYVSTEDDEVLHGMITVQMDSVFGIRIVKSDVPHFIRHPEDFVTKILRSRNLPAERLYEFADAATTIAVIILYVVMNALTRIERRRRRNQYYRLSHLRRIRTRI